MSNIPSSISSHLALKYFERGTFLEIRSKKRDTVVWCDPWINASSYQIVKDQSLERPKIIDLLKKTKKLRHILVTHTHGDHFADVPEIFYQCIYRNIEPYVWGDPNVQSLICEYISRASGTSQKYGFYRGMTQYLITELTTGLDPKDENQRREKGLVHDIWNDETQIPLLYLGASDSGESEYHLVAEAVKFQHSDVSAAFVDLSKNLQGDPDKRRDLCTKSDETAIPMYSPRNEMLGFIFDIYRVPKWSNVPEACTPERRIAGFALMSGKNFNDSVSEDVRRRFGQLDYLFYIPQAERLIRDNGWGSIPSMKVHSGATYIHGDSE